MATTVQRGRPLVSRRERGYVRDLEALRLLRRAVHEDVRIGTARYLTVERATRQIEKALAPFKKGRKHSKG